MVVLIPSYVIIRCEELQIPPFIGFGEDNYRQILTEQKYSLIVKTKRLVLKIFDDFFKDWFNIKC